jgi:two-component system NtrC family sensor kinase
MLPETPFILIFNSFTLALAMSFLLIVLSADIKRRINRYFATFLVFVQFWNLGILLLEIVPIVEVSGNFITIVQVMRLVGLIGSAITLYALITALIGLQPRYFGVFVILYLVIAFGFSVFFATSSENDRLLSQRFFPVFFSIVFNSLTLYSIWVYRRKVSNSLISAGSILFIAGHVFSFLETNTVIVYFAPTISSIGAVVLSFAIIQRILISPLIERGNQLEAMHEVSIAITTRIATDAVLSEIAERATRWLEADAAGVFLNSSGYPELVAVYQLPESWISYQVRQADSIVSQAIHNQSAIYLESYPRDWQGSDDLPFARTTYGSVICVPLVYNASVIGALLVIAGRRGKLLDRSDADLLELLASQAAVAISQGNLFAAQRVLTEQLENAHNQLQTVLTGTDSPVIAVDRKLHIIFTNPAAEKLFELTPTYHHTRLIDVIPRVALPITLRDTIQHIKENRTYQYEFEFAGRSFLCHVATIGHQRIEGFVAIVNDISKLKELDRLKSEMVRMTSHDLKNPLQAALANIELLKDDLLPTNNEEITSSIEMIEKQLEKMNRIISSILDLERVRLGSKLTLICDPQSVIKQAVSELTDYADDQNVHITVNIAENIGRFLGDQDQFVRALSNLIENAIKFNRSQGTVSIEAQNTGSEILFAVRDTGIGIPETLHSRIFDRFFRGHQSGAEHISGSGLGLSLVKSVIDSHNGRIWFESSPGVGSTFFITIPSISNQTILSTTQ